MYPLGCNAQHTVKLLALPVHPSRHTSLRLPRGERVYYNTSRPNIRELTRRIKEYYYEVWVLHIDIAGFQNQEIPRRAWLHTIIISRVILLISAPKDEEQSVSTASDQGNEGSESNEYYSSDSV